MSKVKSIQNVNEDVYKWESAIQEARTLLQKVESRAARLKGAIATFTELAKANHPYNGPNSVKEI